MNLYWILGEQTTKSYKPVSFSNNRVATTATTNSTTSVRPTTSSSVTVHPSLGTLSNHQGKKKETFWNIHDIKIFFQFCM